jgi:hypothetical protein
MSTTQTEYKGVYQRQPEAEEEAREAFFIYVSSQRDEAGVNSVHPVTVSEAVHFYETKLREVRQAAETEKRDRLLARACANRELAAAQMDEDWLGVKLLAYLRESPNSPASELAVMAGAPIDAVAPILARLVRFGAIGVQHRQFACTEKGSELLGNLEAATGISLTP